MERGVIIVIINMMKKLKLKDELFEDITIG